MGLEKKECDIDGLKITVTQFPARTGFKMQAKLAKIFGPALGELVSGVKGKTGKGLTEAEIDLSKFSGAVRTLFEKIDEESALVLIFELLQFTRINGEEVTEEIFDDTFPGKYATLYKILYFVVEVNYGSFFGQGGIGKALRVLKTQQQSVSPQNSEQKSEKNS